MATLYKYSWNEVSAAADRLFIRLFNNTEHATETVYDGNLPKLIEYIFIKCYADNIDRNDEDIQIILNAYAQLQSVSFIGKRDD